jgi:hypothetical protein
LLHKGTNEITIAGRTKERGPSLREFSVNQSLMLIPIFKREDQSQMYDGATQQSMTIYATEHENPMFIMGLSLSSQLTM